MPKRFMAAPLTRGRAPQHAAGGRATPPVRRRIDGSLKLFTAWVFWILTGRLIVPGFFDYHVNLVQAAKNDAIINSMIWALLAAASNCLVFSRINACRALIRRMSPAFLVLLIYTACSVAWSMDPGATLRRLFHLEVILAACMAVTTFGWHERRFQDVVRPVITAFLFGSLIFGLVRPDLAIEPPTFPHTEYYWGGLTIGKNALGAIASTGAILWFHGWATREVRPLTAMAGFGLSVLLIGLARAATYMLATGLSCAVLLLLLRSSRVNRRYMPYVIGALVVVTIVYGLAVLNVVPGLDSILTPVTALTGRDRTFTNRALIWQIAREHISLSPIMGTGYGAFWDNVQPGTPAYEFFVPRMFFNPGECHDGYLEIINDLGYVGLFLLFGYLVTYVRAAVRLLKTHYAQSALYLAVLFQQVLSGLSESNWLWIDAETLIFTLATFCLARHRLDLAYRRSPTPRATPARAPANVRAGLAGR